MKPFNKKNTQFVIFLMGATGTGKSQLALALAEQLPVSIISVDSAQVYRGMDIGTAKPSLMIRAQIPHHLVDIRDPAEGYSVAQFCQDAIEKIEAAIQAGKIPLLVGGTMLYFNALVTGIAPLPSADPVLRARLLFQARAGGENSLYERLKVLDPDRAVFLHPNDKHRVLRALEICLLSGEAMASALNQQQALFHYPIKPFALVFNEKAFLWKKIEERLLEMCNKGFLDEVACLFQQEATDLAIPALRAVGYRQFLRYLEGSLTYEAAYHQSLYATRQLAKRQMTWLRRFPNVRWLPAELPQEALRTIIKTIEPMRYA